MLTIQIGENTHPLSAKLIVAKRIETAFQTPLGTLFGRLNNAQLDELIKIVCISADRLNDKEFTTAIYENCDFSDLLFAVQEIIAHVLFSGTPEAIEAKLAKYPAGETEKNGLRALLGLPIPSAC